MDRPTRLRKQPSRFADFEVIGDSGRVLRGKSRRGGFYGRVDVEVSGDSGRVVRGRGRRGGRGLAVHNQPIRPNALAIQDQTGNRIELHS
jgi:hypothetical protein